MKVALALISVVALAGCQTIPVEKPEPRLIPQTEYVLRIPPKELLTLPPQVPNINVDEAKQSDVARWILLSEERTRLLENMLIELATFFKLEQLKLNEEAKKKNDEALKKAAEEDASRAGASANPAK